LLAAAGRRRLSAVIASHTDEDHIGGIHQILRSFGVNTLVFPAWMRTDTAVVSLLRDARRRNVRVQPVASGSALSFGSVELVVLWPQLLDPPRIENERSLVVRAHLPGGSVLLTADIGRSTEIRMARASPLRAAVLVVPHHGGRSSTSSTLIEATAPSVALIPAAPDNTHGHPHPEVLKRLAEHGIPVRYPARDGRCGARLENGEWKAFP
jgi:competence protein ComEC